MTEMKHCLHSQCFCMWFQKFKTHLVLPVELLQNFFVLLETSTVQFLQKFYQPNWSKGFKGKNFLSCGGDHQSPVSLFLFIFSRQVSIVATHYPSASRFFFFFFRRLLVRSYPVFVLRSLPIKSKIY